jgi:hypothetical protein
VMLHPPQRSSKGCKSATFTSGPLSCHLAMRQTGHWLVQLSLCHLLLMPGVRTSRVALASRPVLGDRRENPALLSRTEGLHGPRCTTLLMLGCSGPSHLQLTMAAQRCRCARIACDPGVCTCGRFYLDATNTSSFSVMHQVQNGSARGLSTALSLDVLCLCCAASTSISELRGAIIDTLCAQLTASVVLATAGQYKSVAARHFQPDGMAFPITVSLESNLLVQKICIDAVFTCRCCFQWSWMIIRD